MNNQVVRCNNCLMPRETTGLSFDQNGICALCTDYLQKPHSDDPQKSAAQINSTVENIKERGKGAPYDCVVGVSGGMDSTYLLYLLVRKHGLRCIAAYYRTPFTPAEIDVNIRKIVSSLSVPLVEIDISKEYHRQVAAYFVRLWNDSHDQILVNLACAPCKFLNRDLYRIAKKHGVRSIVHGINKYESVTVAAGQLRNNKRDKYAFSTNLLKVFVIGSRGMKTLFRHPSMLRYFWLAFQASILYLSPSTAFLRLRYPSISVINYFHEAEWREQEVKDTLDELGWKIPDGFKSMKKADCAFAHLKNRMTSLSSGSNYSDSIYSNMVRYGIIKRDAALKRLEQEGQPPEVVMEKALQIMNLPDNYFSPEAQCEGISGRV